MNSREISNATELNKNQDGRIEATTEIAPETLLEQEQLVGTAYTEIPGSYLGKNQRPDIDSLGLPSDAHSRLRAVLTAADAMFAAQHERAKETPIDAGKLVGQLTKDNRWASAQNIEMEKVRLEEPTPGFFILHLPINEFHKLGAEGQAIAFKPKEGINFIAVQEGFDTDYQASYSQENLPHELHHLVWVSAERQNHIPINESNEHLQAAFRMYRDELLARAVSDGGLSGYTHIEQLRPGERQAFIQDNPAAYKQIRDAVDPLYDLLAGQMTKGLNERGLSKTLLIQSVIMSSNFNELRSNLEELLGKINQLPIIKKGVNKSSTWDAV
jgi:hypothetical protein